MDNSNTNKSKATLKPLQFIAYSAGGMFSTSFYQSFQSLFMMFFLTNIAGFSTLLAATVYSATKIINMCSMFFGGILIDTANFRSGKFRPWMLIGAAMMVLAGGPMFIKYNVANTGVYSFIILALFTVQVTGYNFLWTANRSVVGPMSRNTADALGLATAAQFGSTIGGTLYGLISAAVLAAFAFAGTQQYAATAFCYSLLILAGSFLMRRITKEYDTNTAAYDAAAKDKQNKVSLIEMLRSLKGQNILFFAATFIGNIQGGFFATLLVYYTTYVLKNPMVLGLSVTFNSIGRFLGTLMTPLIAKKMSKKNMYVACNMLNAVLYVCMFFFGTGAFTFIALRTVIGAVGSLNGTLMPAMCNDVADSNEMQGESRARAFIQSLMGTSIRAGSLVSAAVASFGLAATGFASGVEPTAAIIQRISILMVLGPGLCCALTALIMMFYRLDEKALDAFRANKTAEKNS